LGGILNLFTERNIAFDPGQNQFVLKRRGYAGFRLYAATIDDVDGLKRHLEAQGIPVHTEAQRIRDVMELDGYLTLLFLLISAVGICGGVAALTASLYASVERKRKELSVLRLIGFSRGALFRFPVYQGVLIAGSGFLLALAFFFVMAWTVNALFRSHLQAGESFCRLSAWHLVLSVTAVGILASLSSFAAAWRVASIDPAESLRDE
jgi:putative ABC transport system permease protein